MFYAHVCNRPYFDTCSVREVALLMIAVSSIDIVVLVVLKRLPPNVLLEIPDVNVVLVAWSKVGSVASRGPYVVSQPHCVLDDPAESVRALVKGLNPSYSLAEVSVLEPQ